jgi:hypothetical protein
MPGTPGRCMKSLARAVLEKHDDDVVEEVALAILDVTLSGDASSNQLVERQHGREKDFFDVRKGSCFHLPHATECPDERLTPGSIAFDGLQVPCHSPSLDENTITVIRPLNYTPGARHTAKSSPDAQL